MEIQTKSLQYKQNKFHLFLFILSIFVVVIIISTMVFSVYFNNSFQDFYTENFFINNNRIIGNITELEYQLQQIGLQILNDMDTSFLLYLAETNNVYRRAKVKEKINQYKLINNIDSLQIIDLKKEIIWLDSSMVPLSLNEYLAKNVDYAESYKAYKGGKLFLTSDKDDKLTYVYENFQTYLIVLNLSKKENVKKILYNDTSSRYDTWVYYNKNIMLNTNAEIVDILKNVDIASEISNFTEGNHYFKHNNVLYIFNINKNITCISAIAYTDVIHKAIKTASFIWTLVFLLLLLIGSVSYFVSTSFRNMIKRYAEKISLIEKQTEVSITDSIILKIFTHKFITETEEDHLNNVFTGNEHIYYIPIIVMIDHFQNETYLGNTEENVLYKSKISQILEKTLCKIGSCKIINLSKDSIALILSTNTLNIIQQIETINDYIESNYDFTLTFVVGRKMQSITALIDYAPNITELMRYRLITGYNSIIFEENMKGINAQAEYPIEIQDKIIKSIEANDKILLDQLLEEFTTYIIENDYRKIEEWTLALFVSTITNAKIQGKKHIDFQMICNFTNSGTLKYSLEVFKECLLPSFYQKEKDLNKIYFISEVEKYTTENYFKQEYDLNFLANLLNVTPVYLGRKFKLHFEIPFTQYLTEYRVEASMEYLKNTNKKIAEIASLCGFNSSAYFVTIFKKQTLMTPQEYRNKS